MKDKNKKILARIVTDLIKWEPHTRNFSRELGD